MKYFTPELFARFQSTDDEVADRADADWEKATRDYNRRWNKIKHLFPDAVRRFDASDVRVHDADILSVARQGTKLILIAQEEPPCRRLMILTFVLEGEPLIEGDPRGTCWLYEEFDVDRAKRLSFEALLSNNVHIKVRFRDFRFTIAQPVSAITSAVDVRKNGLASRQASPSKK